MEEVRMKEAKEPCEGCGQVFMIPVMRGRPATRCEGCRAKKQAADSALIEINLDNIYCGPIEDLKGNKDKHRPAVGSAESQCVRCGRLFTSDSANEAHKDYRTTEVCRDPATVGMVPRTRRDIPIWTRPSNLGVKNDDL